MAVNWLKVDHNVNRQASNQSGNVSGIQASDDIMISQRDDQWHAWDFQLDSGTYQLSFVESKGAVRSNYFAVGTIPVENQITPMNPYDRFGEVAIMPKNFARPTKCQEPVLFTVTEDQVVRIESWTFDIGRVNTIPLPSVIPLWMNFIYPPLNELLSMAMNFNATNQSNLQELMRQYIADRGFTNGYKKEVVNTFGWDFPTISRRSFDGNTIVFGAEDGVDENFTDIICKLSQVSRSVDQNLHAIQSSFQKNTTWSLPKQPPVEQFRKVTNIIKSYLNDPPPNWITRDHTLALIRTMNGATIDKLPEGIDNDTDRLRILSILDEAKIEFTYYVTYYNGYVPVIVFAPQLKKDLNAPSDLPDSFRVPLSDDDRMQAAILRDRFQIHPITAGPTQAWENNAKRAEWDVVSSIASRLGVYVSIISNHKDITKLSKSLTLSFISTILGAANAGLDASGNNDSFLKMIITCPAFIIGAATTDLTLPLGIGIIALVGTAQLYEQCAESVNPEVQAALKKALDIQTRLKLTTRVLSYNRPVNSYEYRGSWLIINRQNEEPEHVNVTNIESPTFQVNSECHQGEAEYKTTNYENGGYPCMEFHGKECGSDGVWHETEGNRCEINGKGDEIITQP